MEGSTGLEDRPRASLESWIGGRDDAMAAKAMFVEEMYLTVLGLEETFDVLLLFREGEPSASGVGTLVECEVGYSYCLLEDSGFFFFLAFSYFSLTGML